MHVPPDSPLPQAPDAAIGKLYVVKRDGRKETVYFDKITTRISNLMTGLDPEYVDAAVIAQKIVAGVYPGVTTQELDTLAAETCAYMTCNHPDYAILAARIAVSNLHKATKASFSAVVEDLYLYVNPQTGKHAPLVAEELRNYVAANAEWIDAAVVHERDFDYQYFGFKTLEKSYLLRLEGRIVERPQHMLMRVAAAIHIGNKDRILETYTLLSERWFTHATPTLFNAGSTMPQMSSCFLVQVADDSIEGIYETLKTCALISKSSGGIGINVHNIRASGTYIAGTNGTSNGLIPMLRNFDATARFVTQGGGKRNGSIAVYLEPWHPDVFEFIELRKNTGKDENRARDLFLALWVPDMFMRRVETNGEWSMFCPHECPGLSDCFGAAFDALYLRYEAEGRARKTVPAQKLWHAIVEAQMETGTPYLLYKDACNDKSNQKNLGTIKCSNLCTEIIEYTSPDEVAVCNLASIALPKFVRENGEFDHQKLFDVTRVVTRNLNRIIDINHYPVPQARKSNFRHRPIGLGVQGLADAFILMRLPFDSDAAQKLNRDIFETIYFAALTSSNELARLDGAYDSYEGSPVSKGILQHDMWGVAASDRWDWATLRARIAECGVRNSLLVAPMPTASTAQILGNNESIEPYTSNIYTRRVLSGEFQIVNQHLLLDLTRRGLWTDAMKNKIIAANGSIQGIPEIPADLKALYKTVWELSQRRIIDLAADRGAFVDQSQSLNLHVSDATYAKLSSMHFYGWKRGLKTGMYYLRTRAAVDAIKFTVDAAAIKEAALAGAQAQGQGDVAAGGAETTRRRTF